MWEGKLHYKARIKGRVTVRVECVPLFVGPVRYPGPIAAQHPKKILLNYLANVII